MLIFQRKAIGRPVTVAHFFPRGFTRPHCRMFPKWCWSWWNWTVVWLRAPQHSCKNLQFSFHTQYSTKVYDALTLDEALLCDFNDTSSWIKPNRCFSGRWLPNTDLVNVGKPAVCSKVKMFTFTLEMFWLWKNVSLSGNPWKSFPSRLCVCIIYSPTKWN